MVGMSVVTFSARASPSGCWKNWNLKSSMRMAPELGPAEVEELVPLGRSLARQQVHLVVAVEVVLVGPVAELHALQQLAR